MATRYLQIKDLVDILTELRPCAVKWHDLGLKLELDADNDLAPIEYSKSKPEDALREMLVKVLHQKKITWQTIARAVCAIGRPTLADKIEKKKHLQPFKETKRKHSDDSSEPSQHADDNSEFSQATKKRKITSAPPTKTPGIHQKDDDNSQESINQEDDDNSQESESLPKDSSSSEEKEDSDTPTITPLDELCYQMDKKEHGIAVIINIVKHPDKDKHRHGSDEDQKELEQVLRTLGYDVKVGKNLKADQIKTRVSYHAKKAKNCDSFICCILAHGGEGKVVGADGKEIKIGDISKELVGVKHLTGKPKIFFIQACQGSDRPASSHVADSATPGSAGVFVADSTIPTLPRDSDFFYGFASSLETISVRNTKLGSRYIQTLCYILEKQHDTEDLVTMVTRVHNEVARRPSGLKNEKGEPYQQQPQLVSTLRKLVRFKQPSQ